MSFLSPNCIVCTIRLAKPSHWGDPGFLSPNFTVCTIRLAEPSDWGDVKLNHLTGDRTFHQLLSEFRFKLTSTIYKHLCW
jgi:hypothetical protein